MPQPTGRRSTRGAEPADAPAGLTRRRHPAAVVAAAVLAAYALWIAAFFVKGGDIRDFIRIGTVFIERGSDRSRSIHLDRGYRPPANQNREFHGLGYDGQFAYYMALDPKNARYYMDLPSYRYTHVLQPALVRVLALGQRGAIPWLLLLVNWLAVGTGTWAVATWLSRRGLSPWWAAVYGLWPGMLIAVQRDLTEPLGYALVAAAILMLDTRARHRLIVAAALFGLAGLARSTTLVFPLVYTAWIAFRGGLGEDAGGRRAHGVARAAVFGVVSGGPFVAYSAFLLAWLGSIGTGGFSAAPFGGLLHGPYSFTRQGIDLVFVIVPALVALVCLLPGRRRLGEPLALPWFLLLANVLVNIVFYGKLYNSTFTSVSRLGIGIALAALMCLPGAAVTGRRRLALAGALAVAMAALPAVAVYGLTNAAVAA